MARDSRRVINAPTANRPVPPRRTVRTAVRHETREPPPIEMREIKPLDTSASQFWVVDSMERWKQRWNIGLGPGHQPPEAGVDLSAMSLDDPKTPNSPPLIVQGTRAAVALQWA